MLLLNRKTITQDIYLEGNMWPFFIPYTMFWVPLAWGLWFHSWWVWFLALCFYAGGLVIFYLFINSYFWAAVAIVVYSIGWGGTGYALGLLCVHFLVCAPPPLIMGILFYIIALVIYSGPLVTDYKFKLQKQKEGRENSSRSTY